MCCDSTPKSGQAQNKPCFDIFVVDEDRGPLEDFLAGNPSQGERDLFGFLISKSSFRLSYKTDMLDMWRPVGATWGEGQTKMATMLMVSTKALDMVVFLPIGKAQAQAGVCRGTSAYTLFGGGPIWVCRDFSRLSDTQAAMVIIHEALHHAGLGILTYTPSPMRFLSEILERPTNERPFLLLAVGYPAAEARVPEIEKKPLDEIAVFV